MILFMKSYVRAHNRTLVDGTVVPVSAHHTKTTAGIAAQDDRTPDMFKPTITAANRPTPLPLDAAKHPEKYTPDMFTGETAQEKEGRSVAPPGKNKHFYVTMKRDGVVRPAWLAGPFTTHEAALSMVDSARKAASKVDSFSEFDAFGTASVTTDTPHVGVLNGALGLPTRLGELPTGAAQANAPPKDYGTELRSALAALRRSSLQEAGITLIAEGKETHVMRGNYSLATVTGEPTKANVIKTLEWNERIEAAEDMRDAIKTGDRVQVNIGSIRNDTSTFPLDRTGQASPAAVRRTRMLEEILDRTKMRPFVTNVGSDEIEIATGPLDSDERVMTLTVPKKAVQSVMASVDKPKASPIMVMRRTNPAPHRGADIHDVIQPTSGSELKQEQQAMSSTIARTPSGK